MDLECPILGGIQHFRPSLCPRHDCSSRDGDSTFRYWRRGRYWRKCDGRIVHRFHCLCCRRSFSVQTFRVDYWLKRPHLTAPIFDSFVAKGTQRQTARALGIARQTVRHRLLLLSWHARQFQTAALDRMRVRGWLDARFHLDEQETFETDRLLKPVTMPVLIHSESRFVVHVEAATLPARGNLRPKDRARKRLLEVIEGKRVSGSREAVKRCFVALNQALGGQRARIVTDKKSSYGKVLRETMTGRFVHDRYSGKLPRNTANPLWPINHTLMMLRDGLSRLVRKNWGVSKERAWLAKHAWIWIAYRNYIRVFTNMRKDTTSAREAGIVSRVFSKTNFFEWRVFATR